MLRRVLPSSSTPLRRSLIATSGSSIALTTTTCHSPQRHGSTSNFLSNLGLLCFQSTEASLNALDATIAATTGLSAVTSPIGPIVTVLLFGFLVRLLTVVTLSLYSDRALDRIAQASPELQKAFLLYAEVAWNPHALRAEVELAGKRYGERSMKIMRKFHTSSMQFSVPNWSNGIICAAAAAIVCWVAPPLGLYHVTSYPAVAGLNVVNAAATGLIVRNADMAFNNQKGFYEKRDQTTEWQRTFFHRVAAAWVGLYAFVSIFFFLGSEKVQQPAAADKTAASGQEGQEQQEEVTGTSKKTVFVAPDGAACIPFFLLGIAAAGALRRPLRKFIKRNGLLHWPPKRPKLHGTYGEYYWNLGDHWSNMKEAAAQSGEVKRTRENYLKGKLQLEYECDRRLSKMGGMWANMFVDSRNTLPPDMGERPQDMAFTGPDKKGMPLSEYAERFGNDVKK